VQNFTEIGQAAAELWLKRFSRWRPTAEIWILCHVMSRDLYLYAILHKEAG